MSRPTPAVRTWQHVAESPDLAAERSALPRLSRIEGIGGVRNLPRFVTVSELRQIPVVVLRVHAPTRRADRYLDCRQSYQAGDPSIRLQLHTSDDGAERVRRESRSCYRTAPRRSAQRICVAGSLAAGHLKVDLTQR